MTTIFAALVFPSAGSFNRNECKPFTFECYLISNKSHQQNGIHSSMVTNELKQRKTVARNNTKTNIKELSDIGEREKKR